LLNPEADCSNYVQKRLNLLNDDQSISPTQDRPASRQILFRYAEPKENPLAPEGIMPC